MTDKEQQFPAPGPIGPAPTWVMVVGAVFGAITLLALFGYAALAGIGYARFICDSFQLLAGGFALGCGLSAAFLGGGAAAQGKFGDTAQDRSFVFSAVGGVAVVIIVFLIFSFFQPKDCDLRQQKSELEQRVAKLQTQLDDYQHRDLRITPQAYNQPRLLADKVQLHYFNHDRQDVTLDPRPGQGVFIIRMADIDEGSTITIAARPSAEVARPGDALSGDTPTLDPTPVGLSSLKYLSMPTYLELQLFLKVGER